MLGVGIDTGILTRNLSLITDAFTRVHNEVVVTSGVKADGIRPDGSFGQHTGIIYNGKQVPSPAEDILY